MLELSVHLSVVRALEECDRRGPVVRSERDLGGCEGGRRWHLPHPR